MSRRPATLVLAALACASAIGCGGSLPAAVSAKHYREAICGAFDGSDSDRAFVADALASDADVFVYAHVVTGEELATILPADAAKVHARAHFVRVVVQSNELPVDGLELFGGFRGRGKEVVAAPIDWTSMAWVTDEKLPPKHAETTSITAGNIGRIALAGLTMGLSLPFTSFDRRTIMVDAPHAEYERMAPKATALVDAFSGRGGCRLTTLVERGGGLTGQRCEGWFVIERANPASIELHVATTYTSKRIGVDSTARDEDRICTVKSDRALDLGSAIELQRTVASLWPGPGRSIEELTRPGRTTVSP